MYLPEASGVTRGLTDKDPESHHETENLTWYDKTENISSFRRGSKSHGTRRGTMQ